MAEKYPAEKKKEENPKIEGKEKTGNESENQETDGFAEKLAKFLQNSLGISNSKPAEPEPVEKRLEECNIESVAKYILSDKCKNIITMAGAGISTSAGIPDFRSPGTGLYDNLQKYNLPSPMSIFSLDYFIENPEPFFKLSKELWPGLFKPTPCHYFIKLLHDKGLLLRHYTQNIDTLEVCTGMDKEKVVEAHGSFRTGHCLKCRKEYSQDWMKEEIMADKIPLCTEKDCTEGTVKPDIVFFGESLPKRFEECLEKDFSQCDLLIIMGTSLVVQPFASLSCRVGQEVPRLYINLDKTSDEADVFSLMFGTGFKFDDKDNYRDVFWQGKCDDGCYKLAELLGWGKELKNIVKTEHDRLDKEKAKNQSKVKKSPTKTNEKKTTKTAVKKDK